MAFICAAFVTVAARACWVQIVEHDFHAAEGLKRYRHAVELEARRGTIVDRHGALLAVSLAAHDVWAEPKRVDAAARAALAQTLELPLAELDQRLNSERTFVLVKRHVDAQTAGRLAGLNLAGVTQTAAARRVYPEGDAMAHVVGFTDIDDHGQEGVELAADAALRGEAGTREVIRDRLGRFVADVRPRVPPRHGETVRLTIDRRIQQVAYDHLQAALAEHRAQAGSAVVLDARSGEILALANAPAFDPNRRTRRAANALRNRALTDTFEPGSTIKPLLVALAMDTGVAGPTTLIDTAPGRYTIGPNTIHDTSDHGTVTLTEALAKSSNIALAKLALSMPAEQIWTRYQEHGLGRTPELPFPGVAAGTLRPWQRWRPIEQATVSYGYGLSTSLVQMAQAYTVFAGDGRLHRATLLIDETNAGAQDDGPRVTKPETTAAIRTMLEQAASTDGTGRAAQLTHYRVGGKTGTAWKHAGNAYAKGKYRALFVGMAPIDAPRIIVAVMIDEPAGRAVYGGTVAAPVFASIAGAALPLLGVPPDAES